MSISTVVTRGYNCYVTPFPGVVLTLLITATGNNYSNSFNPGAPLIGGSGTGLTADLYVVNFSGQVSLAIVRNGGENYQIGDSLTATGYPGLILTVSSIANGMQGLGVSFIPPRGYSSGSSIARVGGDDAWRKHHKRHQQILRKREEEKLEQARDLRRLINAARNQELIDAVSPAEEKIIQSTPVPDLAAQLELLENELRLLAVQLQLDAIEAKKWRDDDDIAAILLTLH